MSDEISVKISAKLDDLITAFQDAQKGVSDSLAKISESVAHAGEAMTGINSRSQEAGSALASLGETVNHVGERVKEFAAAWLGMEGMKKATELIIETQNANIRLESQFRVSGEAVGITVEAMKEYAEQMQKVTSFDSAEVKQSEALLLQFRNVRGEAFEKTIQTAADLASRFGGLRGATEALGKAQQNPILGLTMMRRAGMELSPEIQNLVKGLVNVGETSRAGGIILEAMAKKSMGTAKAEAAGLGGAITNLKNSFSDLFNDGGPGVDRVTKAVRGLGETLQDPKIKEGMTSLLSAVATLASLTVKAVAGITLYLEKLGRAAGTKIGKELYGVDASLQGKSVEELSSRLDELQQKYQRMPKVWGATVKDDVLKDIKMTSDALADAYERQIAEKGKLSAAGGGGKKEEEKKALGTTPEELYERRQAQLRIDIQYEQNAFAVAYEGSEKRVALAKKMAADILKLGGGTQAKAQFSQPYIAAIGQVEQAEKAHAEQMKAIDETVAQSHRDAGIADIDRERQLMDKEVELGRATIPQKIAYERYLLEQQYLLELEYMRKVKSLHQDEPKIQAQVDAQLLAAKKKHVAQMGELDHKMAQYQAQQFKDYFHPIQQTIEQSVAGMIKKTTTLRDALKNLWGSIVDQTIAAIGQVVEKHIIGEAVKTETTITATATRTAAEQTASKMSIAETARAAIANITTKAAETIANVYNAIAGIPFIGPFLAPALAFAAGALVVGLIGRVASAEGGWEVPRDQLAMVHEDEMILPAGITKGLKSLIAGGGGGSQAGPTFVVQAFDSADVARFFNKHGRAIAASLNTQQRLFNGGSR